MLNPAIKMAMTHGKRQKQLNIRNRIEKTILVFGIISLLLISAAWFNFINHHNFSWRTPVIIQKPLLISEKKTEVHIINQVNAEDLPLEVLEAATAKAQYKAIINKEFGKDASIIKAIAEAESHYNPLAMGWNCRYSQGDKQISAPCREQDRSKAWSVDCGLLQVNVIGQVCPTYLYDPELNFQAAVAKYHSQGLFAWSSYKNNSYLSYLK